MTALISPVAPVFHSKLRNAILSLPEKKFWDLIAIRLNRPTGQLLRQREGRIVTIDLNQEPSVVERWTEACLIDKLFLQLATTKLTTSHNDRCGITVYKYYNQALALRKWIPIARPAPEFVVNLSDLTPRIIVELRALDDPYNIIKLAVGRIFENIDCEQYHLSIASKLKVRVEK